MFQSILIILLLCLIINDVIASNINSKINSIKSMINLNGGSYQRPGPGFFNLGSTCYISSILQSLYYSKPFRHAILNGKFDNDSPGFILQELFKEMENSKDLEPLSLNDLVKSFNINPKIQEDAQEFFLKLVDSTRIVSDNLFGKMEQYLTNNDANFQKHRVERFVDLSVEVADTNDLDYALKKYFDSEIIEDYKVGDKKLDSVKKGLLIKQTPDILYIHLKRFSYDFETGQMKKIGNPFKFPSLLDITSYVKPEILKLRDSTDNIYHLQSIVMHEGTAMQGHYTCYARPDISRHPDRWIHINDHILSEVGFDVVEKEAIGGHQMQSIFQGLGSASRDAYILAYVRQTYA